MQSVFSLRRSPVSAIGKELLQDTFKDIAFVCLFLMSDTFDRIINNSRRLLPDSGLLRFVCFRTVEEPFSLQESWTLAHMSNKRTLVT